MAPKLVLTYFDMGGAADMLRFALELGGLEWEDRRLSQAEFAALKPSLPNGQVPTLEVDGYVLPQSLAILRYVGKLGGLYPTDDLEAAKCDAIMDCTTDFDLTMHPSLYEKDEGKKVEMRKDLAEDFLPRWLGYMSKHLEAGGGSYFLGKLTVADVIIASRVAWLKSGLLDGIPTTIVDAYPGLNALVASISAEPKVAAFMAKHKKEG